MSSPVYQQIERLKMFCLQEVHRVKAGSIDEGQIILFWTIDLSF